MGSDVNEGNDDDDDDVVVDGDEKNDFVVAVGVVMGRLVEQW